MAEIKITPVKKRFRKTKIVLLSFFSIFIVLLAALFLFVLLEMLSKEKTEMIDAPIIYGLKNRVKEIPELKIAIISVLFANFEVNQITDKNKKMGNNRLAK